MKKQRASSISRVLFGGLTLVALLALSSGVAFATTAANHTIRNTVTVNFNDAAGTAMTPQAASADVTVNLVAATATLNAPVDQTTDPNTAAVYNYTITSNANGPDTYNLAENIDLESGDITGSAAILSVPSIDLGGSSVAIAGSIADTLTTAITVPSDDANDGAVNGIILGDTVVINGQVFTVNAIDDSNGGTANATSTITVNGNGTVTAINIGDQIGEQGTFTLTVTPGSITSGAITDQTIDVTVSAVDSAGNQPAATHATITTVTIPDLSGITKEVSTDGGATFVASASADPGDTLTYRITVTNNGSGAATSVVITDPTPLFTTYNTSTAKTNTTPGLIYANASNTVMVDGDATDGYDYNITTPDTSTYSAGTIPAGDSVVLYFQVTIDN